MNALPETVSLWIALAAYLVAAGAALVGLLSKRFADRFVLAVLVLALMVHAAAIGLRWERLGHGPFVTMYEILSSNIWSLTAVFTLAYWRIRAVRPVAAIVLPAMLLMMAWLLTTSTDQGHLPATYRTVWMYIHIGLGKVFFGTVLVALGISMVVILRSLGLRSFFVRMPGDLSLDELAYRFMAVALVFDSLMLVAGAVWAQDAWGRYWNWDPLEVWALITWLWLAFAIHARLTMKPGPVIGAVMVIVVFTIGFLTFFGVPFLSRAPHQGMV